MMSTEPVASAPNDKESTPTTAATTTGTGSSPDRKRQRVNNPDAKEGEDSKKDGDNVNDKHLLEFKWTIYNFDDDGEPHSNFSMFEDELNNGDDDFSNSRCIFENEAGESGEFDLEVRLVDGKSDDRTVLAKTSILFWREGVNLMNFNIHSQDLAHFSKQLWVASGRRESLYNPMAIEFGDSRYSGVPIVELLEEGWEDVLWELDVVYLKSVTLPPGSTATEFGELLRRMFDVCPVTVVAHESDLTFPEARMQGIGARWYVGPIT